MNKIIKTLKRNDVGSIGIGAMIVFIAMVLVAGIAASVLVQTANRLEMQAMTTGDETTSEVSSGIKVFDIEGHATGSGTRELDYLTLSVKPRAGSEDIDLSTSVIELSEGTTKVVLSYDSNSFASAVSGDDGRVFHATNTITWSGVDNEEFGIIVLEDADSSCSSTTPVINSGDTVMLCINTGACFAGSGLDTRDNVWGQVMPEEGARGVFSFRVPTSLTDNVHDLY